MTEFDDASTAGETMAGVDHTHPETGESFGEAFRRGPTVVADGGERNGEEAAGSGPERSADGEMPGERPDETMADVDHEPPTDGVDRAFERGTEGRTDTV